MEDTYLIDDEIKVASCDCLAFQQTGTFASSDTSDTPAGLLEHHHFLYELFFIGVQEVGEFLSAKTCVELKETP